MVMSHFFENKYMVPRLRCIRTKVMDIPFTTTIACKRHINTYARLKNTRRTPPGAGPRKKGLPIFALGKGTSLGFAVTPYPETEDFMHRI